MTWVGFHPAVEVCCAGRYLNCDYYSLTTVSFFVLQEFVFLIFFVGNEAFPENTQIVWVANIIRVIARQVLLLSKEIVIILSMVGVGCTMPLSQVTASLHFDLLQGSF